MNVDRIRIKMCGITNLEDATAAVEAGVDALGFIFYEKSPRNVDPEVARIIIEQLPPFVDTVGVFVDREREEVEEIIRFAPSVMPSCTARNPQILRTSGPLCGPLPGNQGPQGGWGFTGQRYHPL